MAASISDAMRRASDSHEDRSATSEAADWLSDYVASQGGQVASADAKKACRVAGHTIDAIHRARMRLKLKVTSSGYPRATFWELPEPPVVGQSSDLLRGDPTTTTTTTTEAQSSQSSQSSQLLQLERHGDDPATTETQPCAICSTGVALPGRGICSKCDADMKAAS